MKTINLGILAHVDAGKTTLCEKLLLQGGAIRQAGSVEAGNTSTDRLEIERSRGISVKNSAVSFEVSGVRINIIDTPGHMDFTAEVERALYAVDCCVLVISALEGIQSQTELFWKSMQKLNIPSVIFINKIDRAGCDTSALFKELSKSFTNKLMPLNNPENTGSRECSVSDSAISEDERLLIIENSDTLFERYLNDEVLGDDEISAQAKTLAQAGIITPLIYGSAALGIGVDCLNSAVSEYMPKTEISGKGELSGIVYRIEHDKKMGKISHIRLFGGSLKNRDAVEITRGNESYAGKITQIRKTEGIRELDAGILEGGDIASVCGISNAKAGDIIGLASGRKFADMAEPLFSVKVSDTAGNPTNLLKAIMELSDEDPLLHYEFLQNEREIHIKVMGKIQLEVIKFLLEERYGIVAEFSPPTVIYKETPLKSGRGFESYTMPKPCWAVLELQISPLPRGSGIKFFSKVTNEQLFYKYQSHIEETLPKALRQGISGWEVVDLSVTLIGGEHHVLHTHPMDFYLATPIAIMDGLINCGSQLLEPVIKMTLTADEGLSGRIFSDLFAMRAKYDTPVIHDQKMTVEALVPVSASLEYSQKFASLTSGRGRMKTAFHGYWECSMENGNTCEYRGVNPKDRSRYIMHWRGTLGN